MEGLTVAAMILGAILGGLLVSDHLSIQSMLPDGLANLLGNHAQPKAAILVILLLYCIAAAFNLFIPQLPIKHRLEGRNPAMLIADFWRGFR